MIKTVRESIRKHGWELIVLLAAVIACLIWQKSIRRPAGAQAVISYNGEIVLTLSLDRPGIYSLKEDPTIQFQVKDGAAAFYNASCPDRICEQEGFLSETGQTAVCLPRKTVLRIAGAANEEPDIDLVAR